MPNYAYIYIDIAHELPHVDISTSSFDVRSNTAISSHASGNGYNHKKPLPVYTGIPQLSREKKYKCFSTSIELYFLEC